MKNIFALFLVVAMFLVLGGLACDKSDFAGKWTAEVEIFVQHARMHILSMPHLEIILEAESGEIDYAKRELILENIKSLSSNNNCLKVPESMKLSLQFPIPSGCAALITINGEEYFLPYAPPKASTKTIKAKI